MASRSFVARECLGLYTETPLHCGAESGSGYVDLPIQRERHSHFPMIPGSTIKGVLRDEGLWGKENLKYFFGAEEGDGAGSVSFGDAFLVAFPVRSSTEPFVWVTCPLVLERTARALGLPGRVETIAKGAAWSATQQGVILLEELEVTAGPIPSGIAALIAGLAELLPATDAFAYTRRIFGERLVVISDQDFQWIIETGTEIVTRIKLNAKGTTTGDGGNMFNEEVVPRDTLFLAVLRELDKPKLPFPGETIPSVIRLGGHETIGRGVTWVTRRPASR